MKDLANIRRRQYRPIKITTMLDQYSRVAVVCLIVSQLLVSHFIFISPAYSAVKKTDIRILIDVSGSMKVNDPQNLRGPALRLLIGLIPNGTKAGIWTFGKYVNMQVRLGVVNEQWKKLARSEANKIHSRGLYTNIEAVLKKSSYDWKVNDPNTNRHIILLTDGVVDISKDPRINLQSKNKVLDKYLPKLKKAGAKIHTIALSKQADHELLKRLSVTTDGWYELIEDSKQLNRVFLRLFEKSSSANAVPLTGNSFLIDKSINDMTVLTFHDNSGTQPKIITPSKKTFSRKNHPTSVKWFNENSYDLITINHPEPGEWFLDAPEDKDNRVLVVTNLSLSVNDIPSNVMLNQNILVVAKLLQKGTGIKNKNFLKLVKARAVRKSLEQDDFITQLMDDGKSVDATIHDGKYTAKIRSPLRAGVFELEITAQGPTFQRQRKFIVKVFNGLAEIEIKNEVAHPMFKIEVIPHKGLLQKESILINYQIAGEKPHALRANNKGLWQFDLAAENSSKLISFTIIGVRQNNKSIEMQMERMLPLKLISENTLDSKEKQAQKSKPKKPKNSEAGKVTSNSKNDKTKDHNVEATENNKKHENEGSSWLSIMIWVLVINILLGLLVTGGYFAVKKFKAKSAASDKDELKL